MRRPPPALPIRRGADLAGADLSGCDLRGADLAGADLRGADLSGTDLSRADLTGADLRGADARGARWLAADLTAAELTRARLGRGDFTRATLDRADLRHCTLDRARLDRASLRGAALSGSRVGGARLTRADLTGARLTGARLAGSDLGGAVLREATALGARLAGCDLAGVDLQRCRLTRADLRRARLTHADLRAADLTGADLGEADLRGARLTGACLVGARAPWSCFDHADLRAADLRDADLTWAHLDHVGAAGLDLRGADLHRAWLWGDLRDARLDGARATEGGLGGDLRGACLDGADLRATTLVAARLAGASAVEARVDPLLLERLAGAALGPLVLDLPHPLAGRIVWRPARDDLRVEATDGGAWSGPGLVIEVPGPRIRVEPPSLRHPATRWTADPGFDRAVAVTSPDPRDTLARLDCPTRRALVRWLAWGGRIYERAVRIDDAHPLALRLITALRITAALARALPDPDAALMSRLSAEPAPVAHRLLAGWMTAGEQPCLPPVEAVARRTTDGALRELARHGPAQAWAVTRLAHSKRSHAPIDAEGADLRGVDLRGLRLGEGRFAGADLTGADLEGLWAVAIDLRGADLRGAKLSRADLTGADLRSARLDGAQLIDTRLPRADLRGADLSGAELRGVDLTDARLDGCRAHYARFADARLSGARFNGCDAPGARFANAEGIGVRFVAAALSRATFDRARLADTDWRGADLQRARFRGAHIRRSCFVGAETRLATFDEARLERVGLAGCRLDGGLIATRLQAVDLRGCTLAGELDRAVFAGVDLRGATVQPESLRQLDLQAVRLDLAAVEGLQAGRGQPLRAGDIHGVDGRHVFWWHADPEPTLTVERPAPVAARPDGITDGIIDGIPGTTDGISDNTTDGTHDGMYPSAPHGIPSDTTDGIPDGISHDMLRTLDAMAEALSRACAEPPPPPPPGDAVGVTRASRAGISLGGAPGGLTLGSEDRLTLLRKALGADEPQSGDPAFDAAVYIECGEPAALHARLDAPLRAAVMRWVRDGGALADGVLRVPGPLDVDRVVPTLRRGLALLEHLLRPLDVEQALLQQARHGEPPGVRPIALAHWMTLEPLRLPPAPEALAPGVLEGALLHLLAGERADRDTLIDWLGDWGSEAAVPALAAIGGRWLAGRALKARVDRAIGAITRRVGGLRSGGLSVTAGADDGRVSPVDPPD